MRPRPIFNGMNQRTIDILMATVKEYIRTGDPVSSKALFQDFDFGIRPASIRAELNNLEEAGWLEQPYISGGRIPTDRALKLFSDTVKGELTQKQNNEKKVIDLAELIFDGEIKMFVQEMSKSLHLLSAGLLADNLSMHSSGLDELFNCIEYPTAKIFYEIAKEVESLEERMAELLVGGVNNNEGPRALIGKKSPLIKNEQISTVFDIFEVNNDRMIFATFGPRSMDYKKNFKVFLTLREALQNHDE